MKKKYVPAQINAVRLSDPYLAPRMAANYQVTIPSSIRKCHETGRIEAFKLNWKPGMPNQPHIFWDSDVAKVLEGMAYAVAQHPEDRALAEELDSYVDLIISAQQPDGYLNIVFTSQRPEERWSNLYDCHELYCAGHLMEAAVAHFRATGSRKFLDALCRYADYIATVFGTEPGKLRGYPGHEEIELALCKLADASGNSKYYDLARYFVDERGRTPNYFVEEGKKRNGELHYGLENRQAHKPVREQHDAVGHSVRALYLYTGMADVAAHFDDAGLFAATEKLYQSIVNRRMYLTGGLGSTPIGEAFTEDYHLPNDTAYAESCASMALVQFTSRMLNITGDGRYADIMEQTLYNGALSGISLHGDHFFYANLLEVDDNTFTHGVTLKQRQPWFDCSCCPTSYCRFLPQLGSFCWSQSREGDAVEYRLNIPAAGVADFGTAKFEVGGTYPNDGNIPVTILASGEFALSLRIPAWCRSFRATLNGEALQLQPEKGFLTLKRRWNTGDRIELQLDMPIDVVRANYKVTADAGRIALMRGPVVYAFESIDNGNVLPRLRIPADQEFSLTEAAGLPGICAISARAKLESDNSGDALYLRAAARAPEMEFQALAIPYALWQNRGAASMAIWMREEK